MSTMSKLDVDMTDEELQQCLMGDFRHPTTIDRIIVGVPLFFLTIIGLHLNITLWRIISVQKVRRLTNISESARICNPHALGEGFIDRNFKRHVVSLICSSIGYNLVELLTVLPIIAFGIRYPDTILIAISTPDSIFYQVTLYNTLTIALDRFMMFLLPNIYRVFSGKAHFVFVISPWILACFIVGHSTYLGCHKRFNPYQLRLQYGCSACPFYFDLLGYFATYMPVAIFVMYLCIFTFILMKKFSAGRSFSLKRQKKDLLFVVQFSIITVFQVCASQFFYIVDYITSDIIIASLLMLAASSINTYTNPIVMIVFQKKVRKSFLAWSRRLWLFTADLKSLVPTDPSVFTLSQAPSGMKSSVAPIHTLG